MPYVDPVVARSGSNDKDQSGMGTCTIGFSEVQRGAGNLGSVRMIESTRVLDKLWKFVEGKDVNRYERRNER